MNDNNDYRADGDKKRKKGLGWLLPLLLIPLLAWLFFFRGDDANNTSQNRDTAGSSQTAGADAAKMDDADQQPLKQKYEKQFNNDARAVFFNPDTIVVQDEASTNTKLEAIAAFAKQNSSAKFQVNGSIFDDQQVDSTSALAKQRAELVKDRLVEKGVSAANISVSTQDNYEGQDEAARAQYARSVIVTVKE